MEKLIKSLENKGYKVSLFSSKEEATNYLNSSIDNTSVGIGGSTTIEELGLYPLLKKHNIVNWHQHTEGKNHVEVRHAENNSDVYISSVNAITINGEIVNLDGFSNRVSAISFGPKKIYLVFGINKIVDTLDEAINRTRNIAAPLNAKRLNLNTPCAIKADKCYNCESPQSICRTLSILLKMPKNDATYECVIIKENLGF